MVRRAALTRPSDDDAVPPFFWDRNVTAGELRSVLADREHPDRLRLLGTLLREARPGQVWDWVTPADVAEALPQVKPFLGRRRAFWEWLIDGWSQLGLL
ncbi:MAG: hypothetical protein H6737_16340 [Alphaproteobacteria bacterium]|nr:hypothetical protein [Alphaproteobacteria bacterium]